MTEPTIDTTKHARDMSPAEYEAKLAELRRSPPPKPPPVETPTLTAKDMSEYERAEWLAEHRRKFR